jgi:hypothetical protein
MTTFYSSLLHILVSTVTSSLLMLGSGFQRRLIPFLWVLQTVPGHSYQLLTATAHEWTPAILWLQLKVKVILWLMASLSWCQHTHLGPKTNFFLLSYSCRFIDGRVPSLMRRWVCHLQLVLALASIVVLESKSHGTHDHILLSHIRDTPSVEGQVPLSISSRNRMAQLHPQALSSLFVASYDLQGYSGGIQTHLHAGMTATANWSWL